MTGVVGGTATGRSLETMAAAMYEEPWYETERFEEGEHGLAIRHHGQRDSAGWSVWQGDGRAGVLHGAIANRERRGLSDEALFAAVIDEPTAILPTLDGPFLIVCIDNERVVIATDKLGTRPCYYTAADRFLFGSGLGALLTHLDHPEINEQAISDMLLMGHLWGRKTLLEGVVSLPPATVLEYANGTARTERYWKPTYTPAPIDGYLDRLVGTYRTMMTDAATTLDGDGGLWLSGGLDSRVMAAELKRAVDMDVFDGLSAYTYDSNPRGGGNPELARRVAARLDVPITELQLSPEDFLAVIEDAITLTDGMLRWPSLFNLTVAFSLPNDQPNVFFEGAGQGELVGEHLTRALLTNYSVAESMYRSERMVTAADARALLGIDIDPLQTFRDVAARSDERTKRGQILDASFRNYYSRMTLASDAVPQSQVGTRVPFAHKNFLEQVARIPLQYQARTYPGTEISHVVNQPKLELVRALTPETASIAYERTGVGANRPLALHTAGFVVKTGLARLRSQMAYGGRKLLGEWYRHHDGMQAFLDDLIDDARRRDLFDSDELQRLRREHLDEEANHVVTSIAAVTTLENWLQNHID